jgi:hypothetical protein
LDVADLTEIGWDKTRGAEDFDRAQGGLVIADRRDEVRWAAGREGDGEARRKDGSGKGKTTTDPDPET